MLRRRASSPWASCWLSSSGGRGDQLPRHRRQFCRGRLHRGDVLHGAGDLSGSPCSSSAESMKTATIVPVAFPLIAGAGSMTSIISLRAEFAPINIAIAILVNMALVYIVLRLTGRIERAWAKGASRCCRSVLWHHPAGHRRSCSPQNAAQLFQAQWPTSSSSTPTGAPPEIPVRGAMAPSCNGADAARS